MTMLETFSQAAIFIFATLAIILVALKNKWGFVFGLVSQPFWFITAYLNGQWGIFTVSFVFTASWAFGAWKWFARK